MVYVSGGSSGHLLGRGALLGVASGMRSTVGLAALVRGPTRDLPGVLAHRLARPAAGVAVGAELVLDKMPFTGSRLDPEGIAGRLVFAGLGAALLARRAQAGAAKGASVVLLAVACSALSAKVAHDLRAKCAETVPDAAVAIGEDLLALGVAALACRD